MTLFPSFRLLVLLLTVAVLPACAELQFLSQAAKEAGGTAEPVRQETLIATENGQHYKIGNPYQIKGVWYYPHVDYDYSEEGIASWYGPNFHGKPTANGAVFDQNKVSAAHKTLPLPSIVRVTNLENGRSLKVKVNDRGPYSKNRIIDLSRRGAQLLGFENQGTAFVRVEVVEDESRQLAAVMQGIAVDSNEAAVPLPKAAPSVSVDGQDLAAPGSVEELPPPSETAAASAPAAEPAAVERELPDSEEVIRIVSAPTTPHAFIQAGAFSQYVNVQRAQLLLSNLGNVQIEQVMSSSTPLFRVRIGPFTSVDEIDRVLEQVVDAGFPDADIVVPE
ncbi:MAG: septal ring lytic transglycosylase RlpA family protein [Alphaproteobacteria bacterium]